MRLWSLFPNQHCKLTIQVGALYICGIAMQHQLNGRLHYRSWQFLLIAAFLTLETEQPRLCTSFVRLGFRVCCGDGFRRCRRPSIHPIRGLGIKARQSGGRLACCQAGRHPAVWGDRGEIESLESYPLSLRGGLC